MKIVHVIPNLLKGGAERIALNICNELHSKSEHEILLITFEPANAYTFLTQEINWIVVPSDVVPSITGKATINVSELQKTINTFQPDVIHGHLFKSIMVLSQIDYDRAHYFVHFHDNMHQLANLSMSHLFQKKMWTDLYEKRLLYRAFSKRSLSAISISKDTSTYAKQVLPRGVQVHELHNAIDRARFFTEVEKPRAMRLVMIGSLDENKNQLLAIQTIQVLKLRGIEMSLDIIGEGIIRQELERFVGENGLADQIEFHGSIDHPETILRNAAIYIHTAKSEAFGLVLVEAMSAGLPIICTDGGGNRDLIMEGENGFMVPEFSAKLLADKIEYLINNPEKRLEIGRNAQEFSKQFDISTYTHKLVSIYSGSQLT